MIKSLLLQSLAVLLILTNVSCQKRIQLPKDYKRQKISFPESTPINDIVWVNKDTVFLCGGINEKYGYIYLSADGGKQWKQVFKSNSECINTIFTNYKAGYFAAGDSLKIFTSKNQGLTWEKFKIANYPWDQYVKPYKKIYAWDHDDIIAVGGQYYQLGIISKLLKDGVTWKQQSWDNQWFDMLVFEHDKVLIAGFGQVLISTNKGVKFENTNLFGESFIDIEQNKYNEIYVLSERGNIQQYSQEGWINSDNIRGSFNSFAFNNHNCFAVGNNGNFWIGDAHAKSWKKIEPFTTATISKISAFADNFLIGCENGELHLISYK